MSFCNLIQSILSPFHFSNLSIALNPMVSVRWHFKTHWHTPCYQAHYFRQVTRTTTPPTEFQTKDVINNIDTQTTPFPSTSFVKK